MALLNCDECKGLVSSEAANCPHCGYIFMDHFEPPDVLLLRKIKSTLNWILLILIIVFTPALAVFLFIVFGMGAGIFSYMS